LLIIGPVCQISSQIQAVTQNRFIYRFKTSIKRVFAE
jgi:hypothetical protein